MPHVMVWISFSATEQSFGLQLSDKAGIFLFSNI